MKIGVEERVRRLSTAPTWEGTVSSLAYRQTVSRMTSEGEAPPGPKPTHTLRSCHAYTHA